MQAEGSSLKRRIGLLVTAVIVATSLFAVPAQADRELNRTCERKGPPTSKEVQCCKNRADNNREENRCIDYVRSH
jgi:hypothetical protein